MKTLPMMSSHLSNRLGFGRSRSQRGGKETLSHQRPTMLDVAALAGVGLTTVSRVVNGKPGVSEATSGRVRAAIEQLDYRHDVHASNLRRSDRKTATIGLVLEEGPTPCVWPLP